VVADAAVGGAGRAWRAVASQAPAIAQVEPDVQDWAVAHIAATVGFAVVTDLRTTAHELGLGANVVDLLDLAQRQLLDAHQRSCLENTLTAVCATPGA